MHALGCQWLVTRRAHMTSHQGAPTLLAVFAPIPYGALADVGVPLVDTRASVLAPVGFAIVPLCCTAWKSEKRLLCMALAKKKRALDD